MSYCKKCYVDSKKAGIIEENGVYFLGSFVTAWNDGTAPVRNRFGFLKFSKLNAGNYTDSVVEIENRFGKVAEEGTTEFAQIRDAAAAKKAASSPATAAPAPGTTAPARNSGNSSTGRNSSTRRNGGGYPDTAIGGQKVVIEYGEKRGDLEYYKSRFSTGIRFPEGVYLFEKPRIENDFCFRDEGPEYDYYKELCNDKKLLEEHFIAHNMEQVREPKEGETMYIIKDSWSTDGRVWIRWANYPYSANDQIVREATEREQQEYRLQLRAVRAEFGKRVDRYLKRFGTSKLHIWSYWADR